jgi:ABC-type lipoprotein release transport system permease subunit
MRNLRRVFRAKRAFSAVIASLILMLLAVAAGVVVYVYVMGWIGGTTGHEAGQYGELSLDTAIANSTTDVITAYVRNIGGISVTPDRAYVNDYNVTSMTSSLATIDPNVVTTVTINATTPGLTKNVTYEVKIVCNDGTTLTFSVKAKD